MRRRPGLRPAARPTTPSGTPGTPGTPGASGTSGTSAPADDAGAVNDALGATGSEAAA
jgi:hypothetical protein